MAAHSPLYVIGFILQKLIGEASPEALNLWIDEMNQHLIRALYHSMEFSLKALAPADR